MRTPAFLVLASAALIVAACSSSSTTSTPDWAAQGQPTVEEIARRFLTYQQVESKPLEISKTVADAHSDGTLRPVSFKVTPVPIRVPEQTAMACIAPQDGPRPVSPGGLPTVQATYPTAPDPRIEHPDAMAGLMSIWVYMNEPALKNRTLTQGPFPVGAIVVKQKTNQGGTAHGGVGGMIKRPAGYDPKNGDWEYFYFDQVSRISSGRIVSCIKCHAGAEKTDYVFGGWLR